MKQKKINFTFILLLFVTSTFSQGFYNHEEPRLVRTDIQRNKIASVRANDTYFKPIDEIYHPLSTFISEYKFDDKGIIRSRKYWSTRMGKSRNWSSPKMYISLMEDSISIDTSKRQILKHVVKCSEPFKFKQNKKRTSKYLNKLFDSALKSFRPTTQYGLIWTEDYYGVLVDTLLFEQKVYLDKGLLIAGDSIKYSQNKISIYRKEEDDFKIDTKYQLLEDKRIKIELYLEEEKPWRIYLYDQDGYLIEMKQDTDFAIYTDKFFYDSEKLHIRSEEYIEETLIDKVEFDYKKKL